MNHQVTLIYDLDDTLVDTSDVYYLARKEFLRILKGQGVTEEKALNIFEHIDSKNMEIFGHSPEKYKVSMLNSYEFLCSEFKIKSSSDVIEKIAKAGDIIINKMPELIDDSLDLLNWGHPIYHQVLFTRGVELLQKQKIKYAGLEKYFDHIKVVSVKNSEALNDFINEIGADKKYCWIIGDSIKSDINPAIELGINSILYLYEHHSYYWQQEYGHEAKGEFYLVKKLSEIRNIIERPNDFEKISVLE